MFGTVRLSDYRCFRREAPASLLLAKGFSSFIGPNNSGKSALLRSLYELRPAIAQLQQLRSNPGAITKQPLIGFALASGMTDPAEIVTGRDDPHCSVELVVEAQPGSSLFVRRLNLVFEPAGNAFRLETFTSENQLLTGQGNDHTIQSINGTPVIVLTNGAHVESTGMADFIDNILRVQFIGAFRNAINAGSTTYYDLQIGAGFINQWHVWKTGGNKANSRAIQRVTEDVRRLMGANSLEINASVELVTLHAVVDGHPYKLSELGSGISQLIVVLGNALIGRPAFVCIDEPETHLHPALQADFLLALAAYVEHGVLFATHSIGLARSNAERCYSVQRINGGSVVRPFERTPRYAEFLGSLGFAALQEAGWNRILLVEGPTDVRAFHHFLRVYGKDRDTVILPLGGSSMINGSVEQELSEVLRLCNRVFAVVDSERFSAEAKLDKSRLAFHDLCRRLGISCLLTERRGTENYLTNRALTVAVGSCFQALAPFADWRTADPFWGKSENWRVAQAMSRAELDATDLGHFLAQM